MRPVMRLFVGSLLAMALSSMASASTVYTSDTNLNDFTAGQSFGTFISGPFGDYGGVPVTPTLAQVDAGLRIYGSDLNPPVIVQFSQATSNIRVFANIDHPDSWDGYQYTILGSNDGSTFTPLFDVTLVSGSGPFTIGAFTGTAPTSVDNVSTTTVGPGGAVGYIADFSFANSYSYYEFGASTVAKNSGNAEPEFTAVSTPVPEPSTWLLLASGIGGIASFRRRFLK